MNKKGVSPVVATLVLVLIAVAAAISFYVWYSGWSETATEDMSGADIRGSITIGGSSTVYEFTAVAVEYYETENPGYKVNYQAGGSGAGVQSVGIGAVDIGSCSRDVKASEYNAYPDMNQDGQKDFGKELVQHTVGYDGVVVIIDAGNPDAAVLTDLSPVELAAVWYLNGGASSIPSAVQTEITAMDLTDDTGAVGPDGEISWEELVVRTTGVAGSGNYNKITLYDRAEHSGTEETFSGKMLDGESTLEGTGITATHCYGNPAILTAVAADPNGMGFNPWAQASASSEVEYLSFDGVDADADTIIAGATGGSGGYAGSRTLNYVTVGEPTGQVKDYLDYVLSPDINQKVCENSDYISIYA